MFYPVTREERQMGSDPYDLAVAFFHFARADADYTAGRGGTTNVPTRTMRSAGSIASPWRIRTSASAIDRTLEVAPVENEQGQQLDVPGQLAEIKRLTGCGWEQLAGLLGCTRQALHRWMNGEAIADGNRERLARLHATLRFVDRGNSEENRAVMDMACDGTTVAELLSQERFDEVRAYAGRGAGRPDANWGKAEVAAPNPEDHWFARLARSGGADDTGSVRAKPQTFKRLQLRKG
ncbi:hypothetical protein RFN28_15405 [Mesorhizobium sp. VK24D]|uniref:HTH cro/C1-type domain-containing protein n=1 Tax=Mesorhizobium album TaxID=3072314 RepID=A0ABU4Y1W2_9HYPH|nr:hypothetical protein [Mesorhizobium sp. VK24D]MDX8479859.1 hypothetical protein [Mesorhizobium sp. VK24D]